MSEVDLSGYISIAVAAWIGFAVLRWLSWQRKANAQKAMRWRHEASLTVPISPTLRPGYLPPLPRLEHGGPRADRRTVSSLGLREAQRSADASSVDLLGLHSPVFMTAALTTQNAVFGGSPGDACSPAALDTGSCSWSSGN